MSSTVVQVLADKLQAHKQSQFTGIVRVGSNTAPQWSVYFHMGRLVWAHSRLHPVRRWHRQLVKHAPHLIEAQTRQLPTGGHTTDYSALRYSKLVSQVRAGKVNRINIAKAVEDYLSEILFDIVHQGTLRQLQAKPAFALVDLPKRLDSALFLIVRSEQAWQQAQYDWQAWQQVELVKCSPNLAPTIGNAEALQKRTSEAVYQHLVHVIDGQQTFRDLAVALNQPLLPLTRRIVPYIRQGVMGLVRVADFDAADSSAQTTTAGKNAAGQSAISTSSTASEMSDKNTQLSLSRGEGKLVSTVNPLDTDSKLAGGKLGTGDRSSATLLQRSKQQTPPETSTKTNAPQKAPKKLRKAAFPSASKATLNQTGGQTGGQTGASLSASKNAPLIIYIDDSPMDSKIMGNILQDAGYRYRNIQESTHALPLLIEHKPQLIFLDLVMPVANGYEICSQVRRVSLFKNIPIVIVTSNDTLSDRVRAKVVGASGFLKKPIQKERVLKVVDKLLSKQPTAATAKTRRSASSTATKKREMPAKRERIKSHQAKGKQT